MSGFQKFVQAQPAPGVEGDFAGTNPRASVPNPVAGAFKVAPGQSVRVGYFAFADSDTGLVYSAFAAAGSAPICGFVAREANEPSALITAFLGESVLTLQDGMPVTLMAAGDYFVNLPGTAYGTAVNALKTTGAPSVAADATVVVTGFTAASTSKANAVTNATPGFAIAAQTGVATVTGANASGVIEVGQRVTGGGLPANVYITAQLSGTPGQAGTYQTNYVNRAAVAAFQATLVQGGLIKIRK